MAVDVAKLQLVEPDPNEPDPAPSRSRSITLPWLKPTVSSDELGIFCRQLALLLETGNALVPSIAALGGKLDGLLGTILRDVHARLEEGHSFSECLSKHPGTFDPLFVNIVRAGEATGELRQSLERLASVLETRTQLHRRLREAMTYPIVLLVVMVLVLTFMSIFVLPRFDRMFADMGAELPLVTRLLLGFDRFIGSSWPILGPISLVAAFPVRKLWRSKRMCSWRDDMKLRLPIVGKLYTESYLFQMFMSLGLLIGTRVPLLDAIRITRGSVANVHFEQFFDRLAESAEDGLGLANAFAESSILPDAVKLMIATGESSGSLHVVMTRLSQRYRDELESDIRRLSSAIEPVMLVVMGILVGVVAIALVVPLFRLSQAVH